MSEQNFDIQIIDNQLVTTSLAIAQAFGKQHKDVLRSIQNLECSEDFNRRNFAPVNYKDQKGEERPMYRVTRDGFFLLVMGFTGKPAMEIKVKFIEAFNAMEQQLKNPPAIPKPKPQRYMKLFRDRLQFLKVDLGFPHKEAVLAANKLIRVEHGFDFFGFAELGEDQLEKIDPPEVWKVSPGHYDLMVKMVSNLVVHSDKLKDVANQGELLDISVQIDHSSRVLAAVIEAKGGYHG